MTFKHVKFEDSVTMRSLERVARDKGWIHDTPISKIASLNETDLSISMNLTENIMKLCAGLRASGAHKYADEVELKFMNYKKAQTLYETSKETGEDLIDSAHPKGSHKLSDMDGDNVIETIIDQHLAAIKLTEKKPTGKLSSASEILNQVKVALGADFLVRVAAPTSEQAAAYTKILTDAANMINNIAKKLETAPSEQVGLNWEDPKSVAGTLRRWSAVLTGAANSGATAGNTKALISVLTNIKSMRSTVQVFNDDNADANKIAAGMIDNVVSKLEQVSWSIQHPNYTPPTEEYGGSTFSKTKPGYHWESKYVIPEEKAEATTGDISVSEIKGVLNSFISQIQQNVLNREEEIYKPIPDSDLGTISIMDQAFDRAENLKNQLGGFSAALKGNNISGQQLNEAANGFSMFKNKGFTNKNSIIDRVSKIQKSIYTAIGLKQ